MDAAKLDLDNGRQKGLHRTDNDFPVAWTKSYGQGRVFYSTFGHLPESWDNPAIPKMYFEAIRWVMGGIEHEIFVTQVGSVVASVTDAARAQSKRLPSKAIKFEDMAVKVSGGNKTRAILDGETHSGFPIEVHETELPAGGSPHAPHQHVHEEMS